MILEICPGNEREALYICVYLGKCMDMSVYVGMCLRAPGGRAGGQNWMYVKVYVHLCKYMWVYVGKRKHLYIYVWGG